MMNKPHKTKQKGFALFYAIVVISIVVSIGISLSLIAVKETSLSRVRRESQFAYYASESGTSCLMYYLMIRLNAVPNAPDVTTHCNGDIAGKTYSAGTPSNYFDYEDPYLYRASTTVV